MRAIRHALIFFSWTSLLFAENDALEAIKIGFIGDIFLGNWAVESIEKNGFNYPFEGCRKIFESVNLVVGNLESPITARTEPYMEKQFLLKSPPGIERGLSRANIRAVTLANNHILDFGIEGMQETLSRLASQNIEYFGAGLNKMEALKEAPFYFEGITFAFVGFSATFPEEFWATDTTAGTAFPFDDDVKQTVKRLSELYDVTIVSFHWGAEKMEHPKDYQVDLAHLSIDSGADLVIGHHPHVVQGVELYRNKPIFYSLGNFAFASYSESAKVAMMVIAEFKGSKLQSARAIPLDVYNVTREFQPIPIDTIKRVEHLDHWRTISLPLNQARDIFEYDGKIKLRQ